MANQRDIDRWNNGRDHWNQWAEERLKAKEKLEKEGKWEVDAEDKPLNDETREWIVSATCDFSDFQTRAFTDFSEFTFPSDANFERASFVLGVDFSRARFAGRAWFNRSMTANPVNFSHALFEGDAFFNFSRLAIAKFNRAKFLKQAQFASAHFDGEVKFINAEFRGHADFMLATFRDVAWFQGAKFQKMAAYRQARFHSNAMFQRANFSQIADFQQAEFERTAKFQSACFSSSAWFQQCNFSGDTIFKKTRFAGDSTFNAAKSEGSFSLANAIFKKVPDYIQMSFRAPARLDDLEVVEASPFQKVGDKERAARYRALKKIAIESHDHVREQIFFASEARERRGNDDPIGSPTWLFSFPYEFFSDFGRSIAGPFWWWLASTMAYWFIYLDQRDFAANVTCKIDPAWEALYLSLKSAFLVIGWERSQKLNQVYSCLYGGSVQQPEIPAAIPFLQMGQTLWSAILIFLFLLAVRNHFRIK